MSYFIFVQDRETEQWRCVGTTGRHIVGGTKKRPKYAADSYLYPKPEAVNCFIKAHKIIEAEKEEQAWQILSSK